MKDNTKKSEKDNKKEKTKEVKEKDKKPKKEELVREINYNNLYFFNNNSQKKI